MRHNLENRFCDNNCGLRNFYPAVLTWHAHSALKESSFENNFSKFRYVVGGYMKEGVQGRQRSLSFHLSLSCHERPLLARKFVTFHFSISHPLNSYHTDISTQIQLKQSINECNSHNSCNLRHRRN